MKNKFCVTTLALTMLIAACVGQLDDHRRSATTGPLHPGFAAGIGLPRLAAAIDTDTCPSDDWVEGRAQLSRGGTIISTAQSDGALITWAPEISAKPEDIIRAQWVGENTQYIAQGEVTLPQLPWEDTVTLSLTCTRGEQGARPPSACPAGAECDPTGELGEDEPDAGDPQPKTYRLILDQSGNWLEEDHNNYGTATLNADGTRTVTLLSSPGWDNHFKFQLQNSGMDGMGLQLAAGNYCYLIALQTSTAGGGVALELVERDTWRSLAWSEKFVAAGSQAFELCFTMEQGVERVKLSIHLGRLQAGQILTINAIKLLKEIAPGESSTPEPAPEPQPEPTPVPVPVPEPTPVPAPEPEPTPIPAPQPEPTPVPVPQPEPTPIPVPAPSGYAITLHRCYRGGGSDLEHRLADSTQGCPTGFSTDGHGFTVWSESTKQGYQLAQLSECRKSSATRTLYNFKNSAEVAALRADSAWACSDKSWYIASSSVTAGNLGWSTIYRYDNDSPYSTTLLGPDEGLEQTTNVTWHASIAGWAASVW